MQHLVSLISTLIGTAGTARARLLDLGREESGQTSVEWLGIAAVVVAIIIAITTGSASGMADTVVQAFEGFIADITG